MALEINVQSATGKSFLRSFSQDEPSLIGYPATIMEIKTHKILGFIERR